MTDPTPAGDSPTPADMPVQSLEAAKQSQSSDDQESPSSTGQEPGDDREPFDVERARESIREKNREARKYRERAQSAEAKLAEIERSQMTEAQQVAADRDSFKSRAEAAEQQLARFEVAAEKGLDPKAMRFLTGTTREELAASADELMALLGAQAAVAPATPTPPATTRPTEALRVPAGGSDPADQLSADDLDPAKLAAQLRRTR